MKKRKLMFKCSIFIIVVALFAFCNQKQEQKQQNELVQKDNTISLKTFTPGKDTVAMPKSVSTHTRPKPQIFLIPKAGKTSVIIQAEKGQKIVTLESPQTIPSSFLTYMPNYNTEQGLALSSISMGNKSSICDKKGNLWFGTAGGGVSRYDGKSFTNFTTTNGLPNNYVFCITEDITGNLWFGTDGGGVSCYDGRTFTNFTTAQGLADDNVRSITVDKTGNLWFGTYGGGVSCYDGKSFTNYTTEQGLANDIVFCVLADKTGNLWFGTFGGGVSRWDGKSFTNFTTDQGLANNYIYSITEDKLGNIWFGNYGGLVSYYDGNSFTNYNAVQGGEANNSVLCITEDKTGNLWFGTYGGGVICYDGKTFADFTTAQGLPNNNVYSIIEDKTGNLWFGTDGSGISRYDGKSFTNFTSKQGLANDCVFSIIEDKTGNFWFGTDGGGVSCYDGKSFTNFTTAQGLTNNIVYSIAEDKTGNLWFGTDGGGLSRYDGKSFSNYTKVHGLVNSNVRSITEDKTGNLWFGTDGSGVYCYDGKTFTNFTSAQGLANNTITGIIEDKKGNLWFGTDGGGVSCWNGKSFSNYNTTQGLANNNVYSIIEDKMGNLWFGTNGGGISRWDGKSFTNFTTFQGLVSNNVSAIVQDHEGVIWIGTVQGILGLSFEWQNVQEKRNNINGLKNKKIIPAGLLNISNKELKKYKPVWEIYNNNTGYPIKDVNGGGNNGAMLCDSKGIIWVGTGDNKTALVRFDPKAIIRSKEPLTVILQNIKINNENICWNNIMNQVITGVAKQSQKSDNHFKETSDSLALLNEELLTFNKELTNTERISMQKKFTGIKFNSITKFYPLPENLVLPYSHNNITFEFNAVEPGRHFLVRYQYILEGYDEDWSPVTDKTSASFGNIFEGTYTFRLKACSSDGVWSKPVSYSFKVLPPWYRTWWMYCIYLMVFICSLYLIYRWRIAKLEREKQLLEEKVKLRTSQLQQANEEITAQRDEITTQRDLVTQQKEHIEEIHKDLTDSVNYAKRIQEAVLPMSDTARAVLGEYFILFKPKDVISGDFYWTTKIKNWLIVTVADCTGHGVPGALMSMLGISFLNEIVRKEEATQASYVLNELRKEIIYALQQKGMKGEQKDGMDMSLVVINTSNNQLQFAGANNPLYIVTERKELKVIEADKMPVAIHEHMENFTNHEYQLKKGDSIYLCSDGYEDQFGGPKNRKFMVKQLKELFVSIYDKSMTEQYEILDQTFNNWKGDHEQIDDVTILGLRIQKT